MASPTTYLIDRVVVDVATAAFDCTVKGATEFRVNEGIQSRLEGGAGVVDPTTRATLSVLPVATIRTTDVKTVLDAFFGDSNLVPHIPIVGGTVDLYLQATAAGGLRGGAGTNIKLTISAGIVVPTRLSNDPAELEFEIHGIWDGSNEPLQRSPSEDLPAGSAGATSLYRLCALKDNATVLYQLANTVLDFGIRVGAMQPTASLYGTTVAIDGCEPEMTWETADIATALALCGFSGAAAGAGGLILYLGKYDEDGSIVEAATALTLTMRGGSYWFPEQIRLQNGAVMSSYRAVGLGGTLSQPPLTYSGAGTTWPAASASKKEYMIGPIKKNTTEVPIVAGGTFDFGLDVRRDRDPSLLWPDRAFVMERRPTLRVQTLDGDFYETLDQGAEDSCIVYLRAMEVSGEQVADATAQHVKLTMSTAWWEPADIGAAHAQEVPGSLVVGGRASPDMLTIATASAIT
jgi:hypothetical protein